MVKKVYEMRSFELKKSQGSFTYVLSGNNAYWQIANSSFSARIMQMSQRTEISKQGLGYLQIPGKKALTAVDIARESYTGMFTTDKGISYMMICSPLGVKSTHMTVKIDNKVLYNKKVMITFQSLKALTDESEKIVLGYAQSLVRSQLVQSKVSQPMQSKVSQPLRSKVQPMQNKVQPMQSKVSQPMQSKVQPMKSKVQPLQSKVSQPVKTKQPVKSNASKLTTVSSFMIRAKLNKKVHDFMPKVCKRGGERFQCMDSPQTVAYICSSLEKSKSDEELSKLSDAALMSEMTRLCNLLLPQKKR